MDQNLTISTKSFLQQTPFNQQGRSVRREISRGVNTPEILYIGHAPYAASKGNLAGWRSSVVFEYWTPGTLGSVIPISGILALNVPSDPLVTTAMALVVIENFVNLIQEDDTGLNLASAIFASREQ